MNEPKNYPMMCELCKSMGYMPLVVPPPPCRNCGRHCMRMPTKRELRRHKSKVHREEF